MSMNTEWRFERKRFSQKSRQPMQASFFTTSSIDDDTHALVRESIQNSLDARAGMALSVSGFQLVHFQLFQEFFRTISAMKRGNTSVLVIMDYRTRLVKLMIVGIWYMKILILTVLLAMKEILKVRKAIHSTIS